MQYYQQGDTIYLPIKSIPKKARPIKEMPDVVQWGETSHHAHRLYGDGFTILETPEKTRHLRLLKETPLRHEEHKEIKLPPGDYDVRIVREKGWFDDMINPVID